MCVGVIGDYVECFVEVFKYGVFEFFLRFVAGFRENGWFEKYGFKRYYGEILVWFGDF